MIVTFCGHSKTYNEPDLEDRVLEILKNEVKDEKVEFYLGNYGRFDSIAMSACVRFKQIFPSAKLFFITPYIQDTYLKNRENSAFDEVIYPELETTPKKYAILVRNKWMVQNSDLVIAYINHSFGGAYKTLEYAQKTKKKIINLGTFVISN